jgi:hypothetical protein
MLMNLAEMLGKYRSKAHETDLSTQQSKAQPEIWISRADENPWRTVGFETAPRKRPD